MLPFFGFKMKIPNSHAHILFMCQRIKKFKIFVEQSIFVTQKHSVYETKKHFCWWRIYDVTKLKMFYIDMAMFFFKIILVNSAGEVEQFVTLFLIILFLYIF